MSKISQPSLISGILITAGLILGILLISNIFKSPRTDSETYPYLSKRIFVEDQNDILINFVPLRTELRNYVKNIKDPIGIYFEYLPSGTSVGVNDQETFFAASLLKIPVVMKVYKLIEEERLDPNLELTIEEKNIDKGFGDLWKKGAGTKVRLGEVIKLSITQSDNTADKMLRDLIAEKPVSDIFDYFDIPTNVEEEGGAGVTPKGFASVLKGLYLSAYLPYNRSNEILEIMTNTIYQDRLVAGVPNDVKVAHKVGIYRSPEKPNVQVHSDCGIIYLSKRPYLLCVMSDSAIDVATKQIAEVSKIVFDFVNSANR